MCSIHRKIENILIDVLPRDEAQELMRLIEKLIQKKIEEEFDKHR